MKVLISTRNGAATLPRTLAALEQLRLPKSGLELHIADNGSTDETADVLGAWSDRLPMTRYYVECPGKNVALNHMLAALTPGLAGGELLVFSDDDTIAEPDWLVALEKAAKSSAADVFAGRIDPVWPEARPDWLEALSDEYGVLYAGTSRASGPCECDEAWGPNMAIRARIFQRGERFARGFGPDGTAGFPMGSETELMRRLTRAGSKAEFVNEAGVAHLIKPDALTLGFVARRARRHGLGHSLIRLQQGRGAAPGLLGVAAMTALSAVVRRLAGGQRQRALALYRFNWARGILSGVLSSSRTSRAAAVPDEASEDWLDPARHGS